MAGLVRSVVRLASTGKPDRFADAFQREARRIDVDIKREVARRVREAQRQLRPIVRRIYQQELRRHAPRDSGRLRRSIRVHVRNAGGDTVLAEVDMHYYGAIINGASWSRHHGWAYRARDQAESRIWREAVRIFQQTQG